MAANIREQALRLYGRLLRAQRKTFSRDAPLIEAAWRRTRAEFEAGQTLNDDTDTDALVKKIKEGREVCELLEHNVIQAELQDNLPHRPRYKLNFRPEIEINDGHLKGKIGKCC